MSDINNIKRYRFKEDYRFDNDIYDVRKLGVTVKQWETKKGDIIFGEPSESFEGYMTVIISPSKHGDLYSIPSNLLEEI